MFAYCCEHFVDYSRRIFWILWICAPLRSKTIWNSRVLGYGQLKGHVASIVSMFYQKKVLRKEVCLRGTGIWNIVPTRYGGWKAGSCLQEILQRKVF